MSVQYTAAGSGSVIKDSPGARISAGLRIRSGSARTVTGKRMSRAIKRPRASLRVSNEKSMARRCGQEPDARPPARPITVSISDQTKRKCELSEKTARPALQ